MVGDAYAAGESLYGVHWWEYSNQTVGSGPTGGWSVETVITNSAEWWQGSYFEPLYQQVTTTHNAEIVTRVDYNWGETVPAPTTTSAAAWGNRIVNEVIGPLGAYATRWVLGNEPNIIGEGNNWASNQITPTGYAQIYNTVRQAIKAVRPNDEVLFAPVSPGGVIGGVRWKDGNQWLAEAIDATLALPGGAIDGFAIHAYGNPFTGATQAVTEFHNTYVSQLAVIDARPLEGVPVYLTEWNRSTSTSGDLAANEQVSADFLRLSLIDVDTWNRTPGNHNIRSLGWFVYNKDYGDAWNQYSIEWWRSQGNPEGHPGDLWTALMNSSGLQAGLVGTRPAADYDTDGMVSTDDYDAWQSNFGRTDWPFADGSHNGQVDAADYALWRKLLAESGAGSALVPVPEPTTATLLLIAAMALAVIVYARHSRRMVIQAALLATILFAGCSGKPSRVDVADINPSRAAGQAMELYDQDADGRLSDAELQAVPGILKWKERYDLDSDSFVSKNEIAERIEKWQSQKLGMAAIGVNVTMNGQPVSDVEVVLKPEPYLGEALKPASGVTNSNGYAALGVALDDLPEALKQRGLKSKGVYVGTYKIVLSHPRRQLPDTTSSGAPLGEEIALDTMNGKFDIALSSR
jgi:hypothetical protein